MDTGKNKSCGTCEYYCDGFCDLKGILVEEEDIACRKFKVNEGEGDETKAKV